MWCVYPATSSWLKQFILCGPAQKWRHSGTTCPGPEPGLCQERQVPIWTPAWNSTWFWTSVEKEHQRPAISSCCSKGPAKRLMGRNVTFNDCGHFILKSKTEVYEINLHHCRSVLKCWLKKHFYMHYLYELCSD